jgi:hypothetical protein
LFCRFYPYAKRQFRAANARLTTLDADLRARFVAEHEAAELLRLSAAYKEFIDWAAIIGSVLHRPAGKLPETRHADPAKLDLPDAVRIGITETDLPQRRRLAAIVGRRHYRRGWASGLLVELTAMSMATLKFEKGLAENDPNPEPEVDWQARKRLLDDLMSGKAEIFGRRIRDDVHRCTWHLPLREVFSGLEAPHEQEPEDFLTAIISPPPAGLRESFSWPLWHPGRGPTEDQTYIWAPPSIAAPDFAAETRLLTADGGPTSLIWTARLDVSAPGRYADLTSFRDADEPGPDRDGPPDLNGVG